MNNQAVLEALDFCEDIYSDERDKGAIVYDEPFDIKAQVLESQGFLTITFRGTVGYTNWLTNFYASGLQDQSLIYFFPDIITNETDLMAHQGFTRAIQAIYSKLRHEVGKSQLRLRLYGHSLGGALATLASYLLVLDKHVSNKLDSVITFGSPRVFNYRTHSNVIEKFNAVVPTYYRFCNRNDIVSFVPFNERYEGSKVTSQDLVNIYQATNVFNAITNLGLRTITDLFIKSLVTYTHVGDCYILGDHTYQHIGTIDWGRNFSDITYSNILQYAKYFNMNVIGGITGLSWTTPKTLTAVEELFSSQEILDIGRRFLGINNIGYDYAQGVLESDPLYQKLIGQFGNDEEVSNALGVLQWNRIKRKFYQKHLVGKSGLYQSIQKLMTTKLKAYRTFNDLPYEDQQRVIDRVYAEWIQSNRFFVGKNRKQIAEFTNYVRNALLRKLNIKALKKDVADIQQSFVALVTTSVMFFGVYSYFLNEQRTKGVYEHMMPVYKHNYSFYASRNQAIPKRLPFSKTIQLSDDPIQLPITPPQSLHTPYFHPQGFIYTDRIGSFVLFQ
jgi:hypothetical protein